MLPDRTTGQGGGRKAKPLEAFHKALAEGKPSPDGRKAKTGGRKGKIGRTEKTSNISEYYLLRPLVFQRPFHRRLEVSAGGEPAPPRSAIFATWDHSTAPD